jgi:RimJ/RimL family protein N-acetyltransferase
VNSIDKEPQKIEEPDTEIRAIRMDRSRPCIEFALRFFSDREMMSHFPDEERSMFSVYDAAKAMEQGLTIAYAILDKENGPIGMIWGHMHNRHCIVGHWGILHPFRRHGVARQAHKAAVAAVLADFPDVTTIMGVIAKRNVPSFAGALRCGFTVQGILPKSHMHEGQLQDSWILIKEIR